MPCMSYDTNWANDSSNSDVKRIKAEADKLARIACAAMTELERMGKEDFLILKNEEVGHWWASHKEADRKEQERIAEKARKERVKAEALARLTDEEKELLGLKKTAVKKHRKFPISKEVVMDYDDWAKEVEYTEELIEDLKENYLKIVKGK